MICVAAASPHGDCNRERMPSASCVKTHTFIFHWNAMHKASGHEPHCRRLSTGPRMLLKYSSCPPHLDASTKSARAFKSQFGTAKSCWRIGSIHFKYLSLHMAPQDPRRSNAGIGSFLQTMQAIHSEVNKQFPSGGTLMIWKSSGRICLANRPRGR